MNRKIACDYQCPIHYSLILNPQFSIFLLHERQCQAVDAVTKSCGLGSVVKDMSLVAAATRTVNLCPAREELVVFT